MNLYLIRHGQAKTKEQDPDRPLAESGRQGVAKTAGFLRRLALSVRAVWHSGKTRAAETAEMIAPAVTAEQGVVQRDGLTPMDDVAAIARDLADIGGDLMIVGHLPFLNRLASLLVAGDASADVVAFQNGCCVCLRRDDEGAWRVAWMIAPELL